MKKHLYRNALHCFIFGLLLACQSPTLNDTPAPVEPPVESPLDPQHLEQLPLEPLPIGPGSTGPKPGVAVMTRGGLLDVAQLAALRKLQQYLSETNLTAFQVVLPVTQQALLETPDLRIGLHVRFDNEVTQNIALTHLESQGHFQYTEAQRTRIATYLSQEGKSIQRLSFVIENENGALLTLAEPLSQVCGERLLLLPQSTDPPAVSDSLTCPP